MCVSEPNPPVADIAAARAIVDAARARGRTALLESEGYELLRSVGVATPGYRFARDAAEAADPAIDLDGLPGDRLVVKVAGERIAHKTELGGVVVVRRDRAAVVEAIAALAERLGDLADGFLIAEFVDHDAGPGAELLVSIRWTDDFGPVVSVGMGGTEAEVVAGHLRTGSGIAIVAPGTNVDAATAAILARSLAVDLATGSRRGRPPRIAVAAVVDLIERLSALAPLVGPDGLLEIELNPVAVTAGGLVALDVLARIGDRPRPTRVDPPADGIRRLLEPASIAIVGVSSRVNPGRIILRNLLRDGFEPGRIVVVKPGTDRLDGCRCVPTLGAIGERVDLLVVAVSAADAPDIVVTAIEEDLAASIILIPGGLEEKAGTGALTGRMLAVLTAARARGGGPVVNGGNCLGIRSRPGHYDTMFIPAAKLAGPRGPADPVALLCQSGAFAISRLSRLRAIESRYVITVGNQMDLTVGDHLGYLAADLSIEVVGVYVEGFAPLDGVRFLEAARKMTAVGRSVILYRGGRTGAGAAASASHTAAIAGDAAVGRALADAAGVVVADSVGEFDALLATFTRLRARLPGEGRLAAVTNAGFEAVAIADSLGPLRLAEFSAATEARIGGILAGHGIDGVVDVHDPMDLTPMADDAAFADVVRAVLDDDGVDLGVVGLVPFSAELATLEGGADHDEDVTAPDAIASRLIRLWDETTKPWVVAVDAGDRYAPLRRLLEEHGIPVFPTADEAVRILGRWALAAGGGTRRSPRGSGRARLRSEAGSAPRSASARAPSWGRVAGTSSAPVSARAPRSASASGSAQA